jgi:hypothetical protein
MARFWAAAAGDAPANFFSKQGERRTTQTTQTQHTPETGVGFSGQPNTKQTELAMTLSQTIRPLTVLGAAAILAAMAVPAGSAPIAAAKASFDGAWSVLIVTQKGTCDRAYRYPVQIQNGLVGYAGSASFTVSGKVGDAGAVTVTVARGGQSATGTGHMSASDGSGTWVAASGECSGTWTAERRS